MEIRELVGQKYAVWIEIFDEVNNLALERQHEIEIHPEIPTEMYGAALYARTITSTQAAVLLLEHGLLAQARTVLRAALETLFALCAIVAKPALTPKMLDSHEVDKRRIAQRMRRWNAPDLKAAALANTSPEELDSYIASKAQDQNVYNNAVAADMEDWYSTLYMLLSFSAHSAVSDLASHLVLDDQGQVVEFKNEPEIEGQISTWTYSVEIQLKALQAVATLFKLDTATIEVLVAKFKSAVDTIVGD